MDGIGRDIFVSVGSGVLLGCLTWAWLKLSPGGQRFWDNLGSVDLSILAVSGRGDENTVRAKSIRIVFGVSIVAIIISVSMIAWSVTHPRSLQIASFRVGPNDMEVSGGRDPGYFENTKDFTVVPYSDNKPICVLSDILYSGAFSNCELHHDGNQKSPWKIQAKGNAKCRVTCFSITVD